MVRTLVSWEFRVRLSVTIPVVLAEVVVFLTSSRQVLEYYLKTGHDRFLLYTSPIRRSLNIAVEECLGI